MYDSFFKAKDLFERADRILGLPLFSVMFRGTAGKLREIIKEGGGDEWTHNPILFTEEMIRMLSRWKHTGFNVFCGNSISPTEDAAIEHLACYIIRASFSQERM